MALHIEIAFFQAYSNNLQTEKYQAKRMFLYRSDCLSKAYDLTLSLL